MSIPTVASSAVRVFVSSTRQRPLTESRSVPLLKVQSVEKISW
jgi:hypothetical protein